MRALTNVCSGSFEAAWTQKKAGDPNTISGRPECYSTMLGGVAACVRPVPTLLIPNDCV
jgi:hypothetical protein